MSDRVIGIALFAGMAITAAIPVGTLVFGPDFMEGLWRPLSGIALSFVAVALAVVIVELFRLERGRR